MPSGPELTNGERLEYWSVIACFVGQITALKCLAEGLLSEPEVRAWPTVPSTLPSRVGAPFMPDHWPFPAEPMRLERFLRLQPSAPARVPQASGAPTPMRMTGRRRPVSQGGRDGSGCGETW